ncbi:MAG: hypothetical protein LQ344_002811 [Seirophora lacunosa]|nr:MAG: hypothetical protein LQ344_002811 [Seirophora lacunosa]
MSQDNTHSQSAASGATETLSSADKKAVEAQYKDKQGKYDAGIMWKTHHGWFVEQMQQAVIDWQEEETQSEEGGPPADAIVMPLERWEAEVRRLTRKWVHLAKPMEHHPIALSRLLHEYNIRKEFAAEQGVHFSFFLRMHLMALGVKVPPNPKGGEKGDGS